MSRRRALKIALPAALALGAGTAVAIAAIPASDGTIHACYSTTGTVTGAVRIVDEGQTCATGEQTLTWSQTGPAGPVGPSGPPGDSGSSGGSFGGTDTGSFGSDQGGGPSADIFLKLDGIAGESTDDKHKGEIDVESFAFSTKRSRKVSVSPLRVLKVVDASSPKLMQDATTGHHIKSGVLTFRRAGDPDGVEFLTYKLSDIVVSSYEQGGANPDKRTLGSLEDEVGLSPAKVQVTEKTVDASGKAGPAINASFDLRHH
jgi:type VI secretion system secreted protein Hcp